MTTDRGRADLGPRLRDVGEDAVLARILSRLGDGGRVPGVRLGPGDDAAVLDPAGPVVASTDTLVEDRDFRRAWSGGHEAGVKLVAQNLADVAAMGARPVALLVSVAAPPDLPLRWMDDLATGLAEECRRGGCAVAGGDLSAAAAVVLTATALGVLDGVSPVTRSGARPGDVLALAGELGSSAAGLELLRAGLDPRGGSEGAGPAGSLPARGHELVAGLIGDHLSPRPDYPAGPRAARGGAHALIDVSDGLVRDARRLADASEVLIDLDPVALAPPSPLQTAAAVLGIPGAAVDWVLTGGEDHALLAAFPPGRDLPEGYRPIGGVLPVGAEGPGVLVGGRRWGGSPGWRHFVDG